ncbi:MAG: zinc metallopeptidase [Anaerolineales bacterium]
MFFYNFNYFIFMAPAIILMLIAQWYVNSAYKKWSRIRNQRNITGKDAVDRLIRTARLYDVEVERVAGRLSDHYDPRTKILRLSQSVSDTPSVASLAIAAHELGHAQQDKEGYMPLKFRAALVPMVNIGSYLGWILIFAGLFFNYLNLAWLGVAFFSGGAFFALTTLPVELNASARARQMLTDSGLITDPNEERGVRNVLNAAALTYIAALVQAVLQLLYFVSLIGGRRRN